MTWILALAFGSTLSFADAVTPLVTGNGFGFAVVSLGSNSVTRFYDHPYKFRAPNPAAPFGDGFETRNWLTRAGWSDDSPVRASYYQDESHLIVTETARAKYVTFMPFGLNSATVVFARQGGDANACFDVAWDGVAATSVIDLGLPHLRVTIGSDSNAVAALIPLEPVDLNSPCWSGSDAWALVAADNSAELDRAVDELRARLAALSPLQLVSRELSAFENWRVPLPAHLQSVDEMKLWRQSESVLRMAQSREPNRAGRYNHGLIVAALPEGGWFSPWVRDMAYAAWALIRMGHQEEARAAVQAYFDARPIGRVKEMVRGFEYQIPVVRYFGDGSEETNFSGEYAPNVEFDNWGNVLAVLAEYVERFQDYDLLDRGDARSMIYRTAVDWIAKPLLGNLDAFGAGMIVAKDTSIWEADAGSEQHFSYSTAAAIQGLRGLSRLAAHRRDGATVKWLDENVALLEKGFREAFVRDGFVHGTLEDSFVYNIDSSVLETVNFGAVSDAPSVRATLDAMEFLRMPSGGYRRIRGPRQYDRQEFVFSDYNWARNFLRMGDSRTPAGLMAGVTAKAVADHGFIPEMYVSEINDEYPGAIGAPAGSVPMAGYGAGMFITYVLERDRLAHPTAARNCSRPACR